jgi:hypothetical protein
VEGNCVTQPAQDNEETQPKCAVRLSLWFRKPTPKPENPNEMLCSGFRTSQPMGQMSTEGRTPKLAPWQILLVSKTPVPLFQASTHAPGITTNKFPKKTYGAYLVRKSANKTN